jgi:mannose-6-phosphate isomerase-like protein (cupin superfamily)
LPAYFFECLAFAAQGKGMQAYLADFPHRKPGDVQEHVHEGSEFLFVISGSLTVHFEGEDRILKEADSVYFDATEPHSYRGTSRTRTRALVVTTPPRF